MTARPAPAGAPATSLPGLAHPGPTRGPGPAYRATVMGVAAATGAAVAGDPLIAVGVLLLAALAVAVWARPALAALLLIGTTPLVAGIDRGVVLPVLRPNEALELFLGAILAARGLARLRSGRARLHRPEQVEWSLLALALTSSVLPLAVMTLRRRELTTDDLLSGLALWKLAGVYLIVRFSVVRLADVRRCLQVSVAAASVVAVVGILQGLGLLGMRDVLATYYAQFGDTRSIVTVPRGGSTLSLPAATGDLMIMNLALLSAWWLRERRRSLLCGLVASLLVAATLAAGEFSSAIGLVVGAVTLVVVTQSAVLCTSFACLAVGGTLAVWPVVERRLHDFQSASGLPVSWIGRLHNLRTYFWPQLHSPTNVLLGVRPSARVHVPFQATGWVWIESGYTWLLWAGGIPLLASFVFFVYATVSRAWAVARGSPGVAGVAATGTLVGVVVTTVLMTLDPHLTYRGSADQLFALLALTAVAAGPPKRHAGMTGSTPEQTRDSPRGADRERCI
jgi:hypothetical protein